MSRRRAASSSRTTSGGVGSSIAPPGPSVTWSSRGSTGPTREESRPTGRASSSTSWETGAGATTRSTSGRPTAVRRRAWAGAMRWRSLRTGNGLSRRRSTPRRSSSFSRRAPARPGRSSPARSTTAWRAGFPTGSHIVFGGGEPGAPARLYVQDLEGGSPRPVSPDGGRLRRRARPFPVSPDGRFVLTSRGDGSTSGAAARRRAGDGGRRAPSRRARRRMGGRRGALFVVSSPALPGPALPPRPGHGRAQARGRDLAGGPGGSRRGRTDPRPPRRQSARLRLPADPLGPLRRRGAPVEMWAGPAPSGAESV